MFKKFFEMTEDERKKLAEMTGKIMLWIEEGRSIGYMSEKLNIHPQQVECNINEMLYVLRKQVGRKRFLKIFFMK